MRRRRGRRDLFPPDRALQARIVAALAFYMVLLAAIGAGIAVLVGEWSSEAVITGATLACGGLGIAVLLAYAWRTSYEPIGVVAVAEGEAQEALDRLCFAADIRPPGLVVHETPVPLSWTIARLGAEPCVHVTTGLLEFLPPGELRAVLAHELSHLANGDGPLMTTLAGPPTAMWRTAVRMNDAIESDQLGQITMGLVMAAAPITAVLLLGARGVSRYRELAADRGAAALTGEPTALSAALLRLSDQLWSMPKADLRQAGFGDDFHVLPVRKHQRTGLLSLWNTHPALTARIDQLDRLERGMHAARPALPESDLAGEPARP